MDDQPLISGNRSQLWGGHGVAVLTAVGGPGNRSGWPPFGHDDEYVSVCDNSFGAARELGQQTYTSMFNQQEMFTEEAPLEVVAYYGLGLTHVAYEYGPVECVGSFTGKQVED